MGLLDAFKQYVKDAAPGGLLNPELTPQNIRTAGEYASMTPNPIGDVASGLLAVDDLRKGNYGDAALNGIGLLPFVPAMGGITKKAGDFLHGSENVFDEFKIMPNRNPALFFSPVRDASIKTQAEHIADGPFGGHLYKVSIGSGRVFDPLNDKKSKEIFNKVFPNREIKQWIDYPDIYIDSPIINEMKNNGYNRVRVNELGNGFSEAVLDPSLIKIIEKEDRKNYRSLSK